MKTTLLAITIGLTIRVIVCGSIQPPSYRADNRVGKATVADSVAIYMDKTHPEE